MFAPDLAPQNVLSPLLVGSSALTQDSDDEPVTTLADLTSYFASAAQPRARWRLGVEHEKIALGAAGDPLPYEGPHGVLALLAALEARGYTRKHDGGDPAAVIGAGRQGEEITLEPGLQVELSAPPLSTAAACQRLVRAHVTELAEVGATLGVHFVSCGFHPFARLDELPWLPKERYVHMRAFLPQRRRYGHDMMKRTATVQVNHDFADEQDAVDKIRTAMAVSSVVTALYAASPLTEGRPNGYKSFRAEVWQDMDPARCGLLARAFAAGFSWSDYAAWALEAPLFFVARNGRYHAAPGMTFARFMREGWQGQRPTRADWALHLSTLFPEVRLKRTIELRGADAGPPAFVAALPALWRGLLDDPCARREARALVARASFAEQRELQRLIPRAGLDVRFAGFPLATLAAELCAIAHFGLGRLPGGREDQPLLQPLSEYARKGRCPADDMLDDFQAARGDRAQLIARWRLR